LQLVPELRFSDLFWVPPDKHVYLATLDIDRPYFDTGHRFQHELALMLETGGATPRKKTL
jgi:hypothetical protein